MASLCPLPNLFIKEIASSTESTIFTDSLKSRNSSAKSSSVSGFVGKSARICPAFSSTINSHPRFVSSFAQLGRNSEAIFSLTIRFSIALQTPGLPHFEDTAISIAFARSASSSTKTWNRSAACRLWRRTASSRLCSCSWTGTRPTMGVQRRTCRCCRV